MSAPQEFSLGGESTTTVKFDNVGDTVTGTVVSLAERQSSKLGSTTGELDFWPDGKPKMYYSVILQTALRDDPNDDGKRSVSLSGSRKSTEQSSLSAVLDAISRAGGNGNLAVGATLTLTYVGAVPAKTVGLNPRKLYSANYVPAAMSLGGGLQSAGTTVAPAAPLIPPAPVVAAPVAAPAQQFSAEQLAAMKAAGMDISAFVTA